MMNIKTKIFSLIILFSSLCLAMEESLEKQAQELADFFILQRSIREKDSSDLIKAEFSRRLQNFQHNLDISMLEIPGAQSGTVIPTVEYRPKNIAKTAKLPVIIYVHGGPEVYYGLDRTNADLHFLANQGFLVLAPNYRGSKDIDGKVTYPSAKLEVTGPEDIYAVGQYVQNLSYADSDKIILTGICFGSRIIAHLLAKIGDAKFKNIFAGAHLYAAEYKSSSQFNDSEIPHYPYYFADLIPKDFPIFISHGLKDTIAPAAQALAMMKRLVIGQKKVKIFISKQGNHHHIHDDLLFDNKEKMADSYGELIKYFENVLGFFYSIKNGDKKIVHQSTSSQLEQIINAHNLLLKKENDSTGSVISNLYLAQYLSNRASKMASYNGEVKVEKESQDLLSINSLPDTPSIAYLKLVLGDKFKANDLEANVRNFLIHHFDPKTFAGITANNDAGKTIANDKYFFNKIIEILRKEINENAKNIHLKPQYHSVNYVGIKLYAFTTLMREILSTSPAGYGVNAMRLFDAPFVKYKNVEEFISAIDDSQSGAVNGYNYRKGFNECAIATNFTLFGNHKIDLSSSLWLWYAGEIANSSATPIKAIIRNFLDLIYDRDEAIARTESYLSLFNKFAEPQDSALIQMFIDDTLLDQWGYVCETLGERVALDFDGHSSCFKPSVFLKHLQKDPKSFESLLVNQAHKFKNPTQRKDFGQNGFLYNECLQMRLMVPPSLLNKAKINFYPVNEERFQLFMAQLRKEIKADIAALMENNKDISPAITNHSLLNIYDGIQKYLNPGAPHAERKISKSTVWNWLTTGNLEPLKAYFSLPGNDIHESISNDNELSFFEYATYFQPELVIDMKPLSLLMRKYKFNGQRWLQVRQELFKNANYVFNELEKGESDIDIALSSNNCDFILQIFNSNQQLFVCSILQLKKLNNHSLGDMFAKLFNIKNTIPTYETAQKQYWHNMMRALFDTIEDKNEMLNLLKAGKLNGRKECWKMFLEYKNSQKSS